MADFDGVVLTGGASRRMGRDKARIAVRGAAMAVRVAGALSSAGAERVVCVGGDATALTALGLVVVPDDHPGEGPIGGVLTALRWAAPRPVVVCPCDLLDPDAAALSALAAALAPGEAAVVAVPVVDGRVEPLPSAWSPAALAALEAAFAGGERSLGGAIAALSTVGVVTAAAATADADVPGDLPR